MVLVTAASLLGAAQDQGLSSCHLILLIVIMDYGTEVTEVVQEVLHIEWLARTRLLIKRTPLYFHVGHASSYLMFIHFPHRLSRFELFPALARERLVPVVLGFVLYSIILLFNRDAEHVLRSESVDLVTSSQVALMQQRRHLFLNLVNLLLILGLLVLQLEI